MPFYFTSPTICAFSFPGSFDINYDDGEVETNVGVNLIRVLGKSNLPKSPEVVGKLEGAKVEANYRGKGKYFVKMSFFAPSLSILALFCL